MLISYFCGFDAECGNPESVSALQRAKTVVETQYSVVGVVEQRNLSLAVMEAFLPRWFHGVFNHLNLEERPLNNPHPKPSEEVVNVLRERLKLDYDFYSFVLQRLNKQKRSLKL